jgi:dihydroorotase-like cyclic amidohydrolase
MGRILIQNATIFDATGAKPFTGDLLVEGNRIASVTPGGGTSGADQIIDATGLFCMPGMTEGQRLRRWCSLPRAGPRP